MDHFAYYDLNEGCFPRLVALLNSLKVLENQSFEKLSEQQQNAILEWFKWERQDDKVDLTKLKHVLTNCRRWEKRQSSGTEKETVQTTVAKGVDRREEAILRALNFNDLITPIDSGNEKKSFFIQSFTMPGYHYRVEISSSCSCTCEDFRRNPKAGYKCKHLEYLMRKRFNQNKHSPFLHQTILTSNDLRRLFENEMITKPSSSACASSCSTSSCEKVAINLSKESSDSCIDLSKDLSDEEEQA